jgi:hypothetical protein
MEQTVKYCDYGCGNLATHFFKNGKGCCEVSPNKCPIKKQKDSDKKKGNFKGTPAWMIEGFVYNPWNKGKKGVYSDETISKISESLKGKSKGVANTPEKEIIRKIRISQTMKNNQKAGGLRKGSGRGKKGWYRGIWCDSTWELAWVVYNVDHDIIFKRNNDFYEYIFNGLTKKYYPDFIIEGTYYEIKGRKNFEKLNEQNKEKIRQFKKKLVVLYQSDMKPYLDYVIDKYGKDFYILYDKLEK